MFGIENDGTGNGDGNREDSKNDYDKNELSGWCLVARCKTSARVNLGTMFIFSISHIYILS